MSEYYEEIAVGNFASNYPDIPIGEVRNYLTGKNPTNADRIRNMTDDELAKTFAGISACICALYKSGCGKTEDTCIATWLDWLKEEAKNGSLKV